MGDIRRVPGYKLFVWAMLLFPVGFVLSLEHGYLSSGLAFAVRMVGYSFFWAAFLMIMSAYTKAAQAVPQSSDEGKKP